MTKTECVKNNEQMLGILEGMAETARKFLRKQNAGKIIDKFDEAEKLLNKLKKEYKL
ncbi:MAG: hypothetical protein ACI4OW_01870 [Alphaproteobacteria bacterium]